MNESLEEITSDLRMYYKEWKSNEKAKEEKRKEFFDAATEAHKKKTLARKTVRVAADSKEEAWEFASKSYARWKILDISLPGASTAKMPEWIVTLEEDPNLKPYVYISSDGYAYTKQIVEAGAIIDVEAIQKDSPELWKEISYTPEPMLKPLEELTQEQYKKLQDYAYKPKPQIKLGAPRKAKPEEIENENNNG